MTLHLPSTLPGTAATALDDATLSRAAVTATRIACGVVRVWAGDQLADAHGCYRGTASRVWTEWAADDLRNLFRVMAFSDAYLREWLYRRGKHHGSTRGLVSVQGALVGMAQAGVEAPHRDRETLVRPPWTGPQGFYLSGTLEEAHRTWLCAKWDRDVQVGRLPTWTKRSAPDWYLLDVRL